MTPFKIILVLFACSFFVPISNLLFEKELNPLEPAKVYSINCLNDVLLYCDSIHNSVKENKTDKARNYYLIARKRFKKIQWLAEYIAPNDVKLFINGPPIPKHDRENGNKVYEPHGFQFLEEQLFDTLTLKNNELLYEINILKESLNQTLVKCKHFQLSEIRYWDAIQFELIRLVSLHLNGYDSPILKQNATETAFALQGIESFLDHLKSLKTFQANEFISQLSITQKYLTQHPHYDSLDRFRCLKNHFQPLYKKLVQHRKQAGIYFMPIAYAVNLQTETLFGSDFFNINYFNRRANDDQLIKKQIALGKVLFYDPILSGNNQRSCASCHKPQFGFSDNNVSALTFDKKNKLKRNTPGLINVAYQTLFFYDGRAFQLEEQASEVMHAQNEMNTVPDEIVNKLRTSHEYVQLFKKAFEGYRDTAVTFYGVLKAIAEYERSLSDWNSPFDKMLQQENFTSSKEIINGYNIFTGKGLCGTCHFVPLFHGLVPPFFNEQEFEVIGVPSKPDAKEIDKDSARYHITHKNIHIYSFKTPGLRNLKYTKPYMHTGNFKTIEEVIDFYIKGGSANFSNPVAHQTLPFDSLILSNSEIKNLISFVNSLNSPSIIQKFQAPVNLPVFNDAKLNKRKIGGVY